MDPSKDRFGRVSERDPAFRVAFSRLIARTDPRSSVVDPAFSSRVVWPSVAVPRSPLAEPAFTCTERSRFGASGSVTFHDSRVVNGPKAWRPPSLDFTARVLGPDVIVGPSPLASLPEMVQAVPGPTPRVRLPQSIRRSTFPGPSAIDPSRVGNATPPESDPHACVG